MMSHFNRKIPVWLITLLFSLSQTLWAGEVPLELDPSGQPTIEVSGTNTNSESDDLPNPNDASQDNPLSVASGEPQGGSGATVFDADVTFHVEAFLDDSQSQFGGSSAHFDGSGDYLSMPN